jgi:hypothetical protein
MNTKAYIIIGENQMKQKEIIQRILSGYLVEGRAYHSPLPDDRAPWHCYTNDGGHSIVCLLEGHYETDSGPLYQYACPVPVKAVIRAGWRMVRGEGGLLYPVVAQRYDPDIGLITDPGDDEY